MAQVLNHVNAQVSIQPKCDLCDHVNDGIYCCYECGKVLCRPCRTTHDNIGAATKDHNVTDLKYVDLISFKNIPNCKEHNTDFSLYCTSCNVLICQECVTTTHSGDTFSTLRERSILMKKEAEVHFVKMEDKLAKSSTIISEIENNHLPEIENQAKCVLEEIKLAMSEIHQVINSKSDLKKTVIEDFEYDEKEQLKIDLANRKHIHNRCSEVKYSFEKLVKEKHALTFLTAYKNLKGKIVDFEDIDQRPIECKRPPQFDRKVFVEDLIDGITSQFEKSDSSQIKTYHIYKDQIPRLIKENERLKLSEKQSKEILEQIDEEMKSLKDTTKILITNTESLHDLLSDMENKLKLSEQQSKQLLEKKEQELKTLEDTNEKMTKENETLHGLLDDIERQLKLSEKQSEDVLERKDKEIKRLEDTHKVMKIEKESLQDQLSDIQSRLKLSGNQYKDVLEEKEIELKRLGDKHVVMKAEKKSLQDQLNNIKSQFKISEAESKEKERNRLEDNQNLLEAEKQSLQDMLKKSDNKFKLSEKQFKQILEENGKEIKRLQDAHIVLKAEKRSLQDLLNDMKSQLEKEKLKSKEWVKLSEIHSKEILEKKERQFKRLETEKESLQYIVNDLNSQLSGIASQQLADGDPGFTDLGDKNRPQKLGERFAELFDETWSSAYESLKPKDIDDDESDEGTMDTLQQIVQVIYDFCQKVSQEQIDRLIEEMIPPVINPVDISADMVKPASEQMKTKTEQMAREYRKIVAPASVKVLQKEIFDNHIKGKKLQEPVSKELVAYVEQCIDLIWYMCIQQPPMEIRWAVKGDKFNKEQFRFSGRKGKKYRMTVWPAVFLHKEGPLVAPGYAVPDK